MNPSRVISDQYGSSVVTRKDGSTVFGRAVEREDGSLAVYSQDPEADAVIVAAGDIQKVEESPVSQMPPGLLNLFSEAELKDLVAYLMSRGDANAPVFRD